MAAPRKKRTKPSSLSAEEIPLGKLEQANIEQLLAQAFLRHKDDATLEKKLKVKELRHLSVMASEYLSSFILVGYSMQDEKVVLYNIPTPKDDAALIDLLRATLIDMANDRP